MPWKIRVAPSLGGGFAGSPYEIWGQMEAWCGDTMEYREHLTEPTLFMGIYGLPDFFALWRHKGRKCILWCGSDITNMVNGYWLDDVGKIRLSPFSLAAWINKNCESYVENDVEKNALLTIGIQSKVVPSFLGDVNKYELCYTPSDKPNVYTSISGDDWKLYGWDKLCYLSVQYPDINFHLYGNKTEPPFWSTVLPHNIIIHGRVPIEQMDAETKVMQGALRLTEFDGFSELIAKSLLWGQHPISIIKYPYTQGIENIQFPEKVNKEGRRWLLSICNKYPWNQK